jgi:PAS domain S-box-containing protein
MVGDTGRILQRTLLGEAIDLVEGVAVFVWNEERRYVAVNDAACRLVGLERQDLIGIRVGDMSPDADEEVAAARSLPFRHGTSTVRRRDGEEVPLEWVTAHTRVAGLQYYVSVVWRRESE